MKKKSYKYKGIVEEYIASEDSSGSSRYLIRTKGVKPLICLGLNPSTANATESDLTISRVEAYAELNNFDSIMMINLYPLRETFPSKLPKEKDSVIFEKNIYVIKNLINRFKAKKILLATGKDVKIRDYLKDAFQTLMKYGLDNEIEWLCTGKTVDGYPKHPSRGEYRSLEPYDTTIILQT